MGALFRRPSHEHPLRSFVSQPDTWGESLPPPLKPSDKVEKDERGLRDRKFISSAH